MFTVSKIIKKIARPSAKHLVVGGIFAVALAGAITLGLSTRQHSSALTTVRECEHNSIDYKPNNGGCGAYSPGEYVQDLRQNDPADLQVIDQFFAPDFTLTQDKYDDFAAHAVDGIAYKNGDVRTMDGTLVVRDAWSIGRDRQSYATSYSIPHDQTSYWKSRSQDVFAIDQIPVMIYFDNSGNAQFIVMKPCGNVMGGTKITSSATCQALNASQDQNNPNAYSFTTNVVWTGNAKLQSLTYHFSDTGEDVTKTSASDVVKHTFAKDGKVTVTISFTTPGGHTITTSCEKQITHVKPMAVCTALVPSALDDKNQQFRFTVKTATDKYTSVKNADFTLDKTNTTTGVTTKDSSGNIYKDYSFTDTATHTVSVAVHFTTLEGESTDTNCQAQVTSTKTPMCTVPGHEGEAPNSPTCGYCQPGIPIGDTRCTPPPPQVQGASTSLVNTGPGDIVGLFAGAFIVGTIGHRLFMRRRAARQ